MPIWVGNHGSFSPFGGLGLGKDKIGASLPDWFHHGIDRGHAETDSCAYGSCAILGKRIQLENASWSLGGVMLGTVSVAMWGELKPQLKVETRGSLQIGGTKNDEIK